MCLLGVHAAQAPQALVPCAPDFCEFPAINPGCRGQPYRYLYCLSATRPTNIGNSLSKLDLQHQAAATWHEPGGTVGASAERAHALARIRAVHVTTAASHLLARAISLQQPEGRQTCMLDARASAASAAPAAGEPVFVPRPGAAAEDDGVVVAPGVDGEGRGFVLVMDAGSWTELARVQLPFAVPNRFHGIWLGA